MAPECPGWRICDSRWQPRPRGKSLLAPRDANPCSGSGLPRFRLANHFPHRHLESVADALERGELDVLLPALDRAVVGTVHFDVVREAFLAVLALFAMTADDFADSELKRGAFHGLNHKVRPVE